MYDPSRLNHTDDVTLVIKQRTTGVESFFEREEGALNPGVFSEPAVLKGKKAESSRLDMKCSRY